MEKAFEEKIKEIIKQLAAGWQIVKMYTLSHPRTQAEISRLFEQLKEVLAERREFEIGIIKREVFCQDKIFFDLSLRLKDFLAELEDRGIAVLAFKAGLRKDELEKFLGILGQKETKDLTKEFSDYLQRENILHIAVRKLKDVSRQDKEQKQIDMPFVLKIAKLIKHYELWHKDAEKILRGDWQKRPENIFKLVESIVEGCSKMNVSLLSSLSSLKKHDEYTFIHCLNVALLSYLQGRNLGLSQDALLDLILGGLLHDIGKIYISTQILNSKEKMSAGEFEKIKSHALEGARLLLENEKFPLAVAVIAFEHHRYFNASGGYPPSVFKQKPHLFSRIVTISDVYDALRSRRSYKGEMTVEYAYEIMKKEKGRLLDAGLLDKFFALIGLWPNGTIVKLSSGQIGIVKSQNAEDFANPQVEVYFDANYQRLPQSFLANLAKSRLAIQKSLHPQGEGRKFVEEILGAF